MNWLGANLYCCRCCFPLREADRRTRLSVGLVTAVEEVIIAGVVTLHVAGAALGGVGVPVGVARLGVACAVTASRAVAASRYTSRVRAAFDGLGSASAASPPRPPLLASHLRAATSRSRASRSSVGAGSGCIACDELPPMTAAEAAAFCFSMVQSKV